ncbi:hypothetical protein IWW38_006165, partial [Coemansia aciculifera]
MLEGQGEEPLAAFDAVVVATPADAAARLVAEAAPNLSRALSAISYEDARVVTHRDAAAVMPQHQGDWRGVNIMSTVGGDGCGGGRAMASHWLNYVEATSTARAFATPLFQTVDPRRDIDPADIARASAFHRSLLSVASQHAVDDIHRLQGARGGRVWVVGAYAAPGVPLLEGCVRSAADVAGGLGVALPFDMPLLRRRRHGGDGAWYTVGLGPGMVRG